MRRVVKVSEECVDNLHLCMYNYCSRFSKFTGVNNSSVDLDLRTVLRQSWWHNALTPAITYCVFARVCVHACECV